MKQFFSALVTILCCGAGCHDGARDPVLARIRQPTGLAITDQGHYLFVTNGNWDLANAGGTVMVVDLDALRSALSAELPAAGALLSAAVPCRQSAVAGPAVECEAESFILADQSVAVGSGLGNIAIDRPVSGGGGSFRVLIPQRVPPALIWLDVAETTSGIKVDCGQDRDFRCDAVHRVSVEAEDNQSELPPDPSRIVLDGQGFRFGYLPHLLGGSLSLIDLDGRMGPELSLVYPDFFLEGDLDGLMIEGGFGVAQRPCDPQRPPLASRECTRPLLYASHRYYPGLRSFVVAPGVEVILPLNQVGAAFIGTQAIEARPIMGDLEFETENSLLVVQTTPPALGRIDTSVDASGVPADRVLNVAALCDNPNLLDIYRPDLGPALALVSCFGDGVLAVVDLNRFEVVSTVALGAGANEIEIDRDWKVAIVANVVENSISVVDLDVGRPSFLTEIARVGAVGVARENPR